MRSSQRDRKILSQEFAADMSLSHGNSNSFSVWGAVLISVSIAFQHFEILIPFTVNGKKGFNS